RWLKLLAALKKFQLNQKLCFEKASPCFANQDGGGGRSPARGQQIIDHHNLFARVNRVDVHLHFRFALLERVAGNLSLERELATFADRNEADAKLIGDCRPKEEPARIDPNDFVDLSPAAAFQEQID